MLGALGSVANGASFQSLSVMFLNTVENISEKIREARLRYLGHVKRKTEEDVVMRKWKMEMDGHRNIGRRKLRWSDVIRNYMKEKGVKIEEAQDRRT